MSLWWRLLRNHWRTLLLAGGAGIVAGLSSAGLLAFINMALQSEGLVLPLIAWAFGGLCVVVLLSGVLSDVLLVQLGQERVLHLRMELSRRILAAPLIQLQALGPHRLLASLTEDIGAIAVAYQAVPMLCINGAIVLGCLCYLGWLEWRVLLLVLVFLTGGVTSFRLLEARALHRLSLARNCDDTLYQHFRALTEGCKELKMHKPRRQAFIERELWSTADSIREHVNSGMLAYILANHWGNMLFYAAIGLVLFVIPQMQVLSTTALAGYALAILYMMRPLGEVMSALPALGRGVVAWRKIEDLDLSLSKQARERDESDDAVTTTVSGPLDLVGVTHSYRHEKDDHCFILGPIDLVLQPGELIFLIGGNGSGKTTLAMLLLGLYVPQRGEVRCNGELITDLNRDAYRQHFAAVFADPYLFESLLGYEGDDLEGRGKALIAQMQLEHKVQMEDGRFSTVDLSQGQRKRLVLLSAYLDDRPFYVFDEWAADQDPVFKADFYTELLPQLKERGKTVVVITHDEHYYHVADRCIKLESGRIVEDSPSNHHVLRPCGGQSLQVGNVHHGCERHCPHHMRMV